jgi:cobalt/nickel transport system permease protein
VHIAEGMLGIEICISGYAVAGGLTALALNNVKQEHALKISVMGACFFVSSLIHIPVPPTSIHLALLGLIGIILGLEAVLAIGVGLFFQALLFQHGGLSTLGVNLCIMGLPAVCSALLFKPLIKKWKNRQNLLIVTGAILAALCIVLATVLMALVLIAAGSEFSVLVVLISVPQGLLALIEGVITGLILKSLLKLKPELINGFPK